MRGLAESQAPAGELVVEKHDQILASDRLFLVENHEATEEGARAAPQGATASNSRTTGGTFMADPDVLSSRDR